MKKKTIIEIPDLDGEQWRTIEGYDERYYVSDLGRVKSFKHNQPILLTQRENTSGYYRVELWKKGIRKTILVSRLVAAAFVDNDDPIHKNTVDHIDGDKHNNKASNLRWMSLSENIRAYNKNKKEKASTKNGATKNSSKLQH